MQATADTLIRRDDVYPSRVADEPSITGRKDPVVHGGRVAASGPLSTQQLESYDQSGFLFLGGFFSPHEVEGLRSEMEGVRARGEQEDADTIIREPGGRAVRSVFAIHRDNAIFGRLARDPRLVGIAEQLLGSRVYIHQSRVNFKPGFRGKEFYWHSDFETWHVEDGMPRMRALSMSIALTDNTPHAGPLMLIPGSHRHYVACVGRTPDRDHYKESLRRQELGVPDEASLRWLVDEFGIEAPVGPAGSIVLFECNTMHGSNSNITPVPRSNVFLVYNSVENALVEPFGGVRPRPGFIAHRDFAPLKAA
jgi:ectoine hydroxylase